MANPLVMHNRVGVGQYVISLERPYRVTHQITYLFLRLQAPLLSPSISLVNHEDLVKAGGLLVLELGHNSLPAVQPLLESPDWTNIAVSNDLAGIPRVLAAERL